MWTLHSPEIHFRYKRERVCRRTAERTRWLLWIANAYLWQRLDRLYIYTHLFLPPPLVLLLPHYSQPHPAFSPVRSTGQTDVFTSYDGLILTLAHFSWLYGSWIKKNAAIYMCKLRRRHIRNQTLKNIFVHLKSQEMQGWRLNLNGRQI